MSPRDVLEEKKSENTITVKVGMVGDGSTGKTCLMKRYVNNQFDEDYNLTMGVNFLEKKIRFRNTVVTFSIWDLGGNREFSNMLGLVVKEATAVLFIFDLTRRATLASIREWYKNSTKLQKNFFPLLVGTKYDLFAGLDEETRVETLHGARKFAKAMGGAPLIFCSSKLNINCDAIFKIVFSLTFKLKSKMQRLSGSDEPVVEGF